MVESASSAKRRTTSGSFRPPPDSSVCSACHSTESLTPIGPCRFGSAALKRPLARKVLPPIAASFSRTRTEAPSCAAATPAARPAPPAPTTRTSTSRLQNAFAEPIPSVHARGTASPRKTVRRPIFMTRLQHRESTRRPGVRAREEIPPLRRRFARRAFRAWRFGGSLQLLPRCPRRPRSPCW